MDKKLRVGLLLDSLLIPAWTCRAVERMIHSRCAEVALVILAQETQIKPGSLLGSFWQDPRHWCYYTFNALDEKLFVRTSNASTLLDASASLGNVPVVRVEPIDDVAGRCLLSSDIEQIKSHQVDVLVDLGSGRLRGDILSAARYGVWAYRWGDRRRIEDGLTGFWEVAEGCPETGASLQQLGPGSEQPLTLFESWYFTYPYSPARSRNYILWAAASFLPRQMERLYRLGETEFYQELKQTHPEYPRNSLQPNRIPSNLMVLWVVIKLIGRNGLELWRRIFFREQWELRFDFGQAAGNQIDSFRKVPSSKDSFWADPHIVFQAPNYYIFIEEYPYRTKRGRISVIEMDQNGNCKPPVPVLKKDCHLSFPYVFKWLGHYYMIPESSGNRTIDLYECVSFPYQWQHRMTLMKNVRAVDSTVVFKDGKWWMFTAIAEQEAAAPQVELFLFYADDLFTDQWHPHPMNPIVSDVKRARGAGGIFTKDGKLFRPSQDCSKAYGFGFDLNEITTLSETDYRERTVTSVRPDPKTKIVATHTYACQGDLTVVDALTRRPKWAKPA